MPGAPSSVLARFFQTFIQGSTPLQFPVSDGFVSSVDPLTSTFCQHDWHLRYLFNIQDSGNLLLMWVLVLMLIQEHQFGLSCAFSSGSVQFFIPQGANPSLLGLHRAIWPICDNLYGRGTKGECQAKAKRMNLLSETMCHFCFLSCPSWPY